jgi:hypothetical protein
MNNINVLHKQDRDRQNLVCYRLSATFWQIVNRLLPTECNSLLFLRLWHAHAETFWPFARSKQIPFGALAES